MFSTLNEILHFLIRETFAAIPFVWKSLLYASSLVSSLCAIDVIHVACAIDVIHVVRSLSTHSGETPQEIRYQNSFIIKMIGTTDKRKVRIGPEIR